MIKMVINVDIRKGKIDKNIYGHFSEHLGRCIYEGLWVGRDSPIPNQNGIRSDVVNALRKIKIPVLRWPGGCFADEYHWKDGIGKYENRPKMVNVHWGGVVENNHFGTHEFLELCEMIGAEPYICGNVGSGTVQEMREWIEYLTFDGKSPMADLREKNGRSNPWKIKFFGVGNENWGCGGNMRAEYYADLFRRYSCYIRDFSGNKIYKIAGGAPGDNYNWTEVLMREASKFMDGISLHHYTVPGPDWQNKGSATDFTEHDWIKTMKKTLYMDELITKHSAIMDKYDPNKRIGLIVDEWGTWYDVEPGTNPGFLYQKNTLRDALVAAITLNIFNNHCDRVKMANIAQTVNVLQAIIHTEGEKMILTPTYHIFDMYQVHQDAELLQIDYHDNKNQHFQVNSSASVDINNRIHISLCNISLTDTEEVCCELKGTKNKKISGKILRAKKMNDQNTFEIPEAIKPTEYSEASLKDGNLLLKLPPMSVIVLEIT